MLDNFWGGMRALKAALVCIEQVGERVLAPKLDKLYYEQHSIKKHRLSKISTVRNYLSMLIASIVLLGLISFEVSAQNTIVKRENNIHFCVGFPPYFTDCADSDGSWFYLDNSFYGSEARYYEQRSFLFNVSNVTGAQSGYIRVETLSGNISEGHIGLSARLENQEPFSKGPLSFIEESRNSTLIAYSSLNVGEWNAGLDVLLPLNQAGISAINNNNEILITLMLSDAIDGDFQGNWLYCQIGGSLYCNINL